MTQQPLGITNLFIASDVRSGSTYISEVIAYTLFKAYGVEFWELGKEHFHTLNNDSSNDDIIKVLDNIWSNQIHLKCSKIMCASISIITRESKKDPIVLDRFFGDKSYWIVIRRRNKFAQAVSLAFARKSGLYHYYDNPQLSSDSLVEPSIDAIYDAYRAVMLSDDYLDLFSSLRSNSITIFYEDFLENPKKEVSRVIEIAGINLDTESLQIEMAKLKPTAQQNKASLERDFRIYFQESYHHVPPTT